MDRKAVDQVDEDDDASDENWDIGDDADKAESANTSHEWEDREYWERGEDQPVKFGSSGDQMPVINRNEIPFIKERTWSISCVQHDRHIVHRKHLLKRIAHKYEIIDAEAELSDKQGQSHKETTHSTEGLLTNVTKLHLLVDQQLCFVVHLTNVVVLFFISEGAEYRVHHMLLANDNEIATMLRQYDDDEENGDTQLEENESLS